MTEKKETSGRDGKVSHLAQRCVAHRSARRYFMLWSSTESQGCSRMRHPDPWIPRPALEHKGLTADCGCFLKEEEDSFVSNDQPTGRRQTLER